MTSLRHVVHYPVELAPQCMLGYDMKSDADIEGNINSIVAVGRSDEI